MGRVTIKDVARYAGLSVSTTSRVLNERAMTSPEARRRVQEAMSALGFHANSHARSLRLDRSGTLGVLVSDIRNPFFADIVHGAEQAALQSGMTTIICNANESTSQQSLYLDLLLTQRVDGIIIAPQGDGGQAFIGARNFGMPFVFVDRTMADVQVPSVTSDNRSGILSAVAHLVGLHHRRIGYVAGPQETSTGRERYEAFQDALAEHDLTEDRDLVYWGNFQMASGREGAEFLMNLANPPTAIIAADSLMTLGVVSVCHERGVRIGQELSLVGYDDVPAFSLITPPLTVIAHDPEKMGTEAFNMMHALLDGHDVESVVLPSFLLVRESTGPCQG